MTRPIYEIAQEIQKDWLNVNFGAVPYLGAMFALTDIDDVFGVDNGRTIVTYFLANASTWRGETARRVKKELNAILRSPPKGD